MLNLTGKENLQEDSPDNSGFVIETDYGNDDDDDDQNKGLENIMESFKMLKNTFESHEPAFNQLLNEENPQNNGMDLEEMLRQSESLRNIASSENDLADKGSDTPIDNEFSDSNTFNYETTPVESDPQKEFEPFEKKYENINKIDHETSNEGNNF